MSSVAKSEHGVSKDRRKRKDTLAASAAITKYVSSVDGWYPRDTNKLFIKRYGAKTSGTFHRHGLVSSNLHKRRPGKLSAAISSSCRWLDPLTPVNVSALHPSAE